MTFMSGRAHVPNVMIYYTLFNGNVYIKCISYSRVINPNYVKDYPLSIMKSMHVERPSSQCAEL